VDVVTHDKISYFSSDSEDDLFFIPVKIEADAVIPSTVINLPTV
jgi:hypothetical protein